MNTTNIQTEPLSTVLFRYGVDVERGFLPPLDPPTALPHEPPGDFSIFDEIGNNLPNLLCDGTLENEVKRLPVFNLSDTGRLATPDALLLKTRLDFLIHAFANEKLREGKVRSKIPACLAVPELDISYRFGEPPLLYYPSYSLRNFKRKDPNGPLSPENLELNQYFLGSESERWFVVIHVAIEAAAAKAVVASWCIGDALLQGNYKLLAEHLDTIAGSLREVVSLMRRMWERCDRMEYFTFVRPYLYGWIKKYFPDGMLYCGEKESDNVRLFHRGETGAQSSIFPLLDILFGVVHEKNVLSEHLHEMLHVYTQPKHREFLLEVARRPHLSEKNISSCGRENAARYWECRKIMAEFRAIHFFYAVEYIEKPAALIDQLGFQGNTGTGGTEFIPSLWKHFTETLGEPLVKEMGGAKNAFTTLISPYVLQK